ncbi:MAG TPA: feruloyl-CoA synthase [Candidatus Lustribacter sp.]
MTAVRRRAVNLGPHDLEVTALPGGAYAVRSPHPLLPYARTMTDRLAHWAAVRPDTVYLAERSGGGWRTITYGAALDATRRVAQALLDRGCTPASGVAILSENGIDHALLALAAQYTGIPYVPVSPPYSLMSTDFAKLHHVLALFAPRLVYARDAERYARAFAGNAVPAGLPIVLSEGTLDGRASERFAALLEVRATPAIEAANATVTNDTVAKILFTSGSTGLPKGVINTQRMLCSNQQMNLQAFPFFAEEMMMLDWSPWNHTAGSNQVFNMVLYNGGTLYIDDGKPTPVEFAKSLRNLRDVSPTVYFNVPRGYEALADVLDEDAELRGTFFRRLKMMWYAGAALSGPVFEHMRRLAVQQCGEEIMMTSGLGATETAPSATFANWYSHVSGNIGVPLPGVEVKLVPTGAKLELRVRGPSITPGYLHRDDLTRDAFDEDGYYMMGDGIKPLDPADFSAGFLFDGRIGEDFKLSSGTWVSVGPLRTALLAQLQPLVRDLVICGQDQAYLAILMIPDNAAARSLAGDPAAVPDAEILAHPAVRAAVLERLEAFARAHPGNSTHVARAIFLDRPPSIDSGEITDKGSLNNAIIRDRRRAFVEHLYTSLGHPSVIAIA